MILINIKKNLTLKYALQQFFYWAAQCGIYSFASTYFLAKGFEPAIIGVILFSANFLSFVLQPVIGNIADKGKKNLLKIIMLILSGLSFFIFIIIRFVPVPMVLLSVLYLLGITFMDMQIPLMNSLNVYYTNRSWSINYGLSRAFGSASFSVLSLIIGYVMRDFGPDWMPLISLVFIVAFMIITKSFPDDNSKIASKTSAENTSTLPEFFAKYKWYCISLAGVLFMSLFHVMVENYLIQILSRLGGDSSGVGIALFIATLVETPMMILFFPIYKKLGSYRILFLAALFYLMKAVLFTLAGSVIVIYAAQILQAVTYTFLSPVQMYYAEECTSKSDMVKGQSVITAVYSLGCALGNLLGGQLISLSGVPALLIAGIAVTVLSLVIVMVTVPKALRQRTVS